MNIHEMIIRGVRGEAGKEEISALRRWRAASAENEAEYEELARALGEALHLGRKGRGPRRARPKAREIIRLAEAREKLPASGRAGGSGSRRRWLALVAAAALVAITLGVTERWWGFLSPTPATVAEVRTGPGERQTLQLPDGSLVHLDERTRLEVAEVR